MNNLFSHVRHGVTLTLILLPITLFCQDFNITDTYFNHLKNINAEWQHHTDAAPEGQISFKSDIERIALHLSLVANHLEGHTPTGLSPDQLENRTGMIKALRTYGQGNTFPVNSYHTVRQPYFVDNYGTHCAVGQLMHVSGHDALVAKIRRDHNYDYIRDIKTEGVSEWASTYGLTIDELKWIQPGYSPTLVTAPLSGGTNGPVDRIVNGLLPNSVVFAGNFNEVDGLPCLNIGQYQNGQLSCLGNGIDGVIHDIHRTSNTIIVFGALEHNGIVYPVATHDGNDWNYFAIPDRDGAICTAGFMGGSLFEIAISHDSIPNGQEIWHLSASTAIKKAEVNGIILDITTSYYGRVYAGHFDSAVTYDDTSTTTVSDLNNVIFKPHYTPDWFGTGNSISDTVKTIYMLGSSIYFGGSGNIVLSRYFNGDLQPLISYPGFSSINSINFDNDQHLILGGDFFIQPIVGTYGNHLINYDIVTNSYMAIVNFNGPVNGVTLMNGDIYFGGNFTQNMGQTLNHLGVITSLASINDQEPVNKLIVSPNPFTQSIQVKGAVPNSHYALINYAGQQVKAGQLTDNTISDLEHLPSGAYVLQIQTEYGMVSQKVLK